MKKNKLMILGAGGHAKVCLEIAERMGLWDDIELLDDNPNTLKVQKRKVVGTMADIKDYTKSHQFFVAIGNNKTRMTIFKKLIDMNCYLVSLIDPSSVISKFSIISQGTVIMPKVVINAGSVIGENCIINTSTVIEHDCEIKNHVHLSPNTTICGSVLIEEQTWIGAGCTVINNIKICQDVIVGAGSLVIKNVDQSGTYVGSPAKIREDYEK